MNIACAAVGVPLLALNLHIVQRDCVELLCLCGCSLSTELPA